MYSVVVVHPGVVLANQSPNPRLPPKGKPRAMKLPSETHVLQARHKRPAFGAFSWKLQPNYPKYLQLQGGLPMAEALFCAKGSITTEVAGNCFGEAVDDAMLAEQFGMVPSQENRARLALRLQNDDEKKGQASRYVENLKDMYGNGPSTLCLVYNASGDALRFCAYNDWWSCSLYKAGYPEEIGNGQWAAFLHLHKKGASSGSTGAVVYRGKNRRAEDRDFLLAWDTPWSLKQHNKAYCEIGAVTSYDQGRWDEIQKTLLDKSSYTSRSSSADGVEVDAQTERGTSPTFTAIIKLRA